MNFNSKKIVALLSVIAVCFALSVPAMAENDIEGQMGIGAEVTLVKIDSPKLNPEIVLDLERDFNNDIWNVMFKAKLDFFNWLLNDTD